MVRAGGGLKVEHENKKYEVKRVIDRQAIGALISKRANAMSSMRVRMSEADKAMRADEKFF